jgi:hypothetical protein
MHDNSQTSRWLFASFTGIMIETKCFEFLYFIYYYKNIYDRSLIMYMFFLIAIVLKASACEAFSG